MRRVIQIHITLEACVKQKVLYRVRAGDAGGRERDFDQQEAQADAGAASAVTPARHDMQRALMAK